MTNNETFTLVNNVANHQQEIQFLRDTYIEEDTGFNNMTLVHSIERYIQFLLDNGEIESASMLQTGIDATLASTPEQYKNTLSMVADDCIK